MFKKCRNCVFSQRDNLVTLMSLRLAKIVVLVGALHGAQLLGQHQQFSVFINKG